MAFKMASGSNLQPGGTHVWHWNNYVHDQVYSFAAKPLSQGYYAGTKMVEVTKVRYVVIPQHDAPSKSRIEITVFNPGSSAVNYELYLAHS
jgi:hypothetical protein